jgi:hypothetical protein
MKFYEKKIGGILVFSVFKFLCSGEIGFPGGVRCYEVFPLFKTIGVSSTTLQSAYISNFQAGDFSEVALGETIALQSGFFVSGQGAKMGIVNAFALDSVSETIRLLYFQIPLNFFYKLMTYNTYSLFVGAGIYAEYAIRGIESGTEYDYTPVGSYNLGRYVQFSNHDNSHFFPDVVRAFDAGFNLLVKLEHKNVEVAARYSHGLTDLSAGSTPLSVHSRNILINLSIAYYLFLKRHSSPVRTK